MYRLRWRQSIHTSPTVLPDPENLGVAVEISLLSYLQAEIYDIANVLPVNGGHLWFISPPDVREYPHESRRVAGPQEMKLLSEVWWYHGRITTSYLHPVWRPSVWLLWAWLDIIWYRKNVLVISYRLVKTAWKTSDTFRIYRAVQLLSRC